ncbi:MAG TPA: hypothetical protein DCW68_06465 [Rhodospirillaceae bacterium]|nr:MAG: hypothetical protein A2018_03760 [Alphaproteobacteria bacterium GWF2_58_20]HAU29732.1 hypothetical protein [Rhodospirillaceae bacterium]
MTRNNDIIGVVSQGTSINEGLRSYMLKIYNYMAGGIAVTALVAMLVAGSPAMMQAIFGTPLKWAVLLAPFILVFYMSAKITTMSKQAAQTCFWGYSALMGVMLSSIIALYMGMGSGAMLARAFFITSGTFAGLSIVGYTTKRDLTGMGSFLMMGLWGIILASLVNMFLKSSGLEFALSIISVLVFTGLTAFDTQRLKQLYLQTGGSVASNENIAIMGALRLYMDFINLFLAILRIMSSASRR